MKNSFSLFLVLAAASLATAASFCSTRDEFDCVYINEICWSNSKVEDGAGNFESDWVELYNPRSFPVNVGGYAIGLKGTWIDSESDGKLFVLPSYNMAPGSFLLVFFNKDYAAADTGLDASKRIIRSNAFNLGKNSDKTYQDSVRLFAPTSHTRVSNFKGEDVGRILSADTSYGWVYDGSFDPYGRQNTSRKIFTNPTPGASNSGGDMPVTPDPTLKINEVCYSNSTVDDGMGNKDCDFVELYNPGPDAVNLGGMKLGKKATLADCGDAVFQLPDYLLEPNEFFVVFFNKDVTPASTTVTRTVNGAEKSVPLIRSNVLSLGTGYSVEVPGSEGTNVVVQDSVRLFAANGRRIDNFKGEAVASTVGVKKNTVTGEWEGLVEENASAGYVQDADESSGLSEFLLPTPWSPNGGGIVEALPRLRINEVCYSNSKIDDGTGYRGCDFVEIYNADTKAVSLSGLLLGKKSTLEKCGATVFAFPDYTMDPGEFFVVFFDKDATPSSTTVTRTVNGVAKSVPLIRSNKLSFGTGSSEEVPGYEGQVVTVQDSVRLFAADGRRIDNFKGEDVAVAVGVVKNPLTGVWEGLVEKDASVGQKTDGGEDLAEFYQPTPWEQNAGGLARSSAIVINEVCYDNISVDDGTGNIDSDWIELYNTGPDDIQLKDMKLGKKSTLEKCESSVVTLPEYVMSSNEFLVVFVSDDYTGTTVTWTKREVNGVQKSVPVIRSNAFKLGTDTSVEVPGSEGTNVVVQDSVRLFAANGDRISNFKGEDVAVAVGVTSVGAMYSALLEEGQTCGYLWDGNRLPSGEDPPETEKGRVVLSHETAWGPNNAGYVFAAPDVTGSVPGRYTTVQNVQFEMEPGTKIRYTTDGSDPFDSPTAIEYTAGDQVTIYPAESATAASGGSLTNAWIRTSPVELASKEPNAVWRAPIGSVSRVSVLRAVAVKGPSRSAEYRGTWYIGMDFLTQTLPSVSIIANEADLFSDEKGIYVPGTIYKTNGYGSNKWGKPNANYYGDGEVAAHVELIEPAESEAPQSLVLDAGLALNGGGTRSLPQKALYVKMKSAYGAKSFDYDLFPSLGERTYRRFLLRPNGNDWYGPYTDGVSTMMKDAVFHRIVSGLDMFTMSYRPAVVYLNGSYWGIHNLRESVDKQAFATRYGLDEDLIDVLTHEDAGSSDVSISLIDGFDSAVSDYKNWLTDLKNNDITSSAKYAQYVTAKMDVANYIDYISTECFYANTDWPINNCDFWRSSIDQTATAGKYGDRRWRWALYDLDLAGLVVDGVGGVNRNMLTYLSSGKMSGVTEPGFLINRLWQNATFKNEFIRRYTELLNTTFRPERTSEVIAAAADEIDGEIETHYRRWGRDYTKSNWRKAVGDALVSYTAQRWTNSFAHASAKFGLGGVGEVRVMNDDPSGVGGHFIVDGTVIDAGTDGVTDRADWTGRYYSNRPVTIQAVPDAGYVFDSWVGSAETSAERAVTVTANGLMQFKARFRPASAPAPLALGFSSWQDANCDEQAVLRGADETKPGAVAVSKGGREYTNRELFAFGVSKAEAVAMSPEELKARTSLRLSSGNGLALEYGSSPYGGVEARVQVTESLSPVAWRAAETGTDVGPAETNRSSRDGLTVTVPLKTVRGVDFYRLEVDADGR